MNQSQQIINMRFVLAVLGRDGAFIRAHELHRRIHDLGRPIGMSTVYRALRDLVKRELVDVMVGEHSQRWYRRCSSRPHHHLVCSMCHSTVEIPAHSSPLPAWVTEEATGFTDVVVRVTITGTCAECT
ncbi:Fur family transcriptional regulator [Lentzea albidocapillata]|uniref:Fur family transcriptional regulator, ferric uptake regulator n=1 Tax=Lentzea albidocapillata TaxID=40571 RepID=A0A1W2FQ90_9PSEU|nr:transcriptional repressor [Lentzea albidocapillata]SMD23882.1 Fur family transcriptional regulator, ferric uptake regulator [Lentzea albidocapillata]